MHGDLNDGNVLCPTYDRWLSITGMNASAEGEDMIGHLSLIDLPFCRELAFVYDAAFFLTWLKFLLPGLTSHADQDATIAGYTKAIQYICSERGPEDVPLQATRFVECAWKLFDGNYSGPKWDGGVGP